MKTVYVMTIHQTTPEGKAKVWEGHAIAGERLVRCMKHAMKIDAVFQCRAETVSAEEWEKLQEEEKKKSKTLCSGMNWRYDLPSKAE